QLTAPAQRVKKGELVPPPQRLELVLPAQGVGACRRGLGVKQSQRRAAARVPRAAARAVGCEAPREVVGDAGIESAVGAAEEVDTPHRLPNIPADPEDCKFVGRGGSAVACFEDWMASPPKRPDPSGGTLIDVEEDPSAAGRRGDDAPGSTAVVRVDRGQKAAPLPPTRRPEPVPGAPKKGLQVSLPDDEPAVPPPPKRPVPPDEKRGRRGAWWDEKPEKETEPNPDDLPGRTAVVQAPEPEQQPEPEPKPPAEPEVEPYRPVPADDYQGHVPEGPPRWKVLLRRAAWTAGALVALGVIAALAGYVYISREIPTFDSVRDYHPFVGSKVVASDGSVIAQFYRERRTVVKMDQVPRVLVQAVISAQDNDFGEAAILAGLPQNPSRINPRRHPDRAKKRQIYVLDRMLANRLISREDHDREVEKPIVLPPPASEPPGAWYVDEVRRQLVAQFGDAAVDTAGMT